MLTQLRLSDAGNPHMTMTNCFDTQNIHLEDQKSGYNFPLRPRVFNNTSQQLQGNSESSDAYVITPMQSNLANQIQKASESDYTGGYLLNKLPSNHRSHEEQ